MNKFTTNYPAEEMKKIDDDFPENQLMNIFANSVVDLLIVYKNIGLADFINRLNLTYSQYLERVGFGLPLSLPVYLNMCAILNIKYTGIITLFEYYKKTQFAKNYLKKPFRSRVENWEARENILQWFGSRIDNFYEKNKLEEKC